MDARITWQFWTDKKKEKGKFVLFSNHNRSLLGGSLEHWTDYNNHMAVVGTLQGSHGSAGQTTRYDRCL